jgi:hypothetical protein
MRTIYFHIGMHKTGSTAIQSAFKNFNSNKIRYASLPNENHSVYFFTAFSGLHQSYHLWTQLGLNFEQIESKKIESIDLIIQELKKDPNKDVIFSGEDISRIPETGVRELKTLVQPYCSNIKIIGYARDPFSFMESRFQRIVSENFKPAIIPKPDYRSRFEKFLNVFGKENVNITQYNVDAFPERSVIKDFANKINIDCHNYHIRENVGMSTEAVSLLYHLNFVTPSTSINIVMRIARRKCLAFFREQFPGRFELPKDLLAGIIDAADVKWMYENFRIRFDVPDSDASISNDNPDFSAYFEKISKTTHGKLSNYLTSKNPNETYVNFDTSAFVARIFFGFLHEQLIEKDYPPSFSASRYLELNPDVKEAGADPYKHFLLNGIKEGRAT